MNSFKFIYYSNLNKLKIYHNRNLFEFIFVKLISYFIYIWELLLSPISRQNLQLHTNPQNQVNGFSCS